MRDLLKKLEQTALALEPTPAQRAAWDGAVHNYAHQFMDTLRENKADHVNDNPAYGITNFPFAKTPKPTAEVLEVLIKNLHTSGINPASTGHLGYIPGGGIYPAALGDYLAAVTNHTPNCPFASTVLFLKMAMPMISTAASWSISSKMAAFLFPPPL